MVRVKLPKTEQTEPTPDQHAAILSVAADGKPILAGGRLQGNIRVNRARIQAALNV